MAANPVPQGPPTFINLPQPPSQPDTPSEMPGTPTSTTTSLSALSTVAIKDGHRGHPTGNSQGPGHQHNPSTSSLEAERADRIARLAGLSSINQARPAQNSHLSGPAGQQQLTPAWFDSQGQPVAAQKISTVGSASATTTTAQDDVDRDGDLEMGEGENESLDTNYRDRDDVTSVSGYTNRDEDMTTRSVGGFDDRLSDDGNASLVGFGEGAGSTVSGPIYHRRVIPNLNTLNQGSSAGAMASHGAWGIDRSGSGLGEGLSTGRRDTVRQLPITNPGQGDGSETRSSDTPVSVNASKEHQQAVMVSGMAADDDDVFVDTTTSGPVPVRQNESAIRETQQIYSHQQTPGVQHPGSTSKEAAEQLIRDRLGDDGNVDAPMGSPSPGPEGGLGKFYFEKK
ncbi:hypothetical protein DL546_004059 [Coniochaeta pulveracea]|uniref:Uncharacterized protein n=1 Tax=Coniochaeta pulveracea TaxID=177199 RepID=A0A420Y3Q9_9PEZI|nr:hypothetical protein DL546_004059 [Coniochaeta pulveracea]